MLLQEQAAALAANLEAKDERLRLLEGERSALLLSAQALQKQKALSAPWSSPRQRAMSSTQR